MMKITELLNAQPTEAPRRLDMASLDRFARQHSRDDLVDAAITPLKAPTISPALSETSSNDERSPVGRKRRAAPAKVRVNESDAATALAALAQAAVDAVKQEDDEPVATTAPVRRRGRGAAPKAGKVPSGGRAGPMTDDEKRAKQRMLVKKSYYRKIDTLNTLRETVSQLEHDYNEVLDASKKNRSPTMATPLTRHSIAALVNSSSENELMRSFQDMAVDIDHLRRENENLRAVAMEQSKARTRVGILVHEEFEDQNKRGQQYAEILDQIPEKLRTPEEAADAARARRPSIQSNPDDHTQSPPRKNGGKRTGPVIHMTPMTEDECMDVVRDSYAELMRFRKSNDYITSGGHVFGWRDRRKIDGDYVQFAFEKQFRYRTAEQLAANTWRVLSTERGINRIYSSSVRATYHFVQQVSDHNVVFYRTMKPVGQNVIVKSLILASFVEIESGFMVLFRSIDPSKRNVRDAVPPSTVTPDGVPVTCQRKEVWAEMFSWGVFEASGPNNEHCIDFFGGFVPATVATNRAFWLMEVLLIAVRCESECVGPLFILHQEEDDKEDVKPVFSRAEDVVIEM